MTDAALPHPAGELSEVFARLADALDPRYDVIDTTDLVVEATTRFTGAVEAGLVLADPTGKLHVMGSTSERASDVEEVEVGTDEGPCRDSFHAGLVIETPDIQASVERWPSFVPVATRRGFRSGYAVPLMIRGHSIGALNLFFDRVNAVTDQDAAVAQALADFATIGIVQHRALREQAGRAAQLQHALDSRVVVEQAKGALAYQRNVSIDEAFTLLRNHARRSGARLHDVSEQIINRHLTL
jgi:GAF domain-containing protein